MLIMEGLHKTLSWKTSGDDFARKLSTLRFISQSFQRHLERVLALEEFDGYMDLVLQSSPGAAKTVDGLRQEHEQFRKEARHIVLRFERVARTDGEAFAHICDDLVGLLNRLAAHDKKEASLIQEAFARDEGGEG
jgi:hemerythrin-like domain-containing protein